MGDDVEIPDIQFFGLTVRSGEPAEYAIRNEDGLMELCHVTNVALASHGKGDEGPIFVRVQPPEDTAAYVVGALLPGKQYSFSTDLMISPDTTFSVSGKSAEVHLTGYRSINAEALVYTDDDDSEKDEDSEDSDDRDFVDDGHLTSSDEERAADEEGEGDGSSGEDGVAGAQAAAQGALQAADARANAIRGRQGQAMDKRSLHARMNGVTSTSGSEMSSDEGGPGVASDADNEDDSSSGDGSGGDPDRKVEAIAAARSQARVIEAAKRQQRDGVRARADGRRSQGDGARSVAEAATREGLPAPARKGGSVQAAVEPEPASADAEGRAKGAIKRTHDAGAEEPRGGSKKKAKTKLTGAETGSGAKSPGPESKVQPSASSLPPHPESANPATRAYVEQIVTFLRGQGGRFKMSQLGIQVKRPPDADKFGKILSKYGTWLRRSGDKGQEEMVLQPKLQ